MKPVEAGSLAIRIEGLDILRFLAALAVVCFHFFYAGRILGYMPGAAANWPSRFGHAGVDVFFVISGFVISFCSRGATALDFLLRRFLRLMPAFLVCSSVSALLVAYWHIHPLAGVIELWLASLTFFPHLFGLEYLEGVYWTLSVEVTFYLLVAVAIALGFWENRQLWVVTVWLALAISNAYGLYSPVLDRLLALTFAGHFAAGVILHNVLYRHANKLWLIGLLPSIALMTRYAFLTESGDIMKVTNAPPWETYLLPWIVIAIVLAAITLPAMAPRGWVSLMGKSSYPLYLLHASLGTAIANSLARHIDVGLGEAVAIAAIITISALVVVYAEAPLRKLLRGNLVR